MKNKLKESYIFIPLVIAYFFLGIIYPFLIKDIPKFLLFQILFILLPGYVFSKWFISEKLTKIQSLIFGYPVSMVVLFILSWTGKLLNIRYFEGLIVLFSFVSIYKMLKDKNESKNDESPSTAAVMIFYSICIAIVFRMFIVPSAPPKPQFQGLYFVDSMSNINFTWSYIRGLPLEDARFSGVLIGYSMLKNIYHATMFNFTKILPFNINFYIGPIFDWFIMVFLVFFGGIKIAKFSLRQTLIFCFGLFFTTAFLGRRLQLVLFVNPVTTYFSLAVFILFIFFITAYLNKKRKLDIVYLTALFIYFTGSKGMLGIIIPAVLTIIFIFNLLKKRFVYKELILGLCLILGAILLKFTMFQNSIQDLYYDYDTTTSIAYHMLKQSHFIGNYADIIYPFYRFWSSFFRNLPGFFMNWPLLLFFFIFFTNENFRKKFSEFKYSVIFIFVFFAVSISMMCLFTFPGATLYYMWYSQVIFLILGVYALDYILDRKIVIYKFVSALLLLLGLIVCAADLIEWVKVGWASLPARKERIWDERASISYGEWQAMEWLRKNSAPDETFFSHRRYYAHEVSGDDLPRFYGYSALSGRQAFAEGESAEISSKRFKNIVTRRWKLINKFLASSNPAEQEKLLKDIKANYFVQSLRFNNKDFSKINIFNLVYENKDIKIYKIL